MDMNNAFRQNKSKKDATQRKPMAGKARQ